MIEDICSENGISPIVCIADDNPAKEKKYIETLLAKQEDGLIVSSMGGNLVTYQQLIDE